MEECERFKDNPHLFSICNGTADMPKWKIDSYREKFGLSALFNETKPEVILSYDNIGSGPGSELLAMYKSQGMPPCQDCFKLAKQMNIWGSDCSNRLDYIINDMFPRAKKWVELNMPWANLFPAVGDPVIRMRLRLDVQKAIETWNVAKVISKKEAAVRQPSPKEVVATKFTDCGCGK